MVLKAPIHPLCIKAYIYKRLISDKSMAKHYRVITFISLTSFIWFVLKKERTKERTKTKIYKQLIKDIKAFKRLYKAL